MELSFARQLLDNTKQFAALENGKLPPELTPNALTEEIRRRGADSRACMNTINRIIDESLTPMFENPYTLTDEAADAYASLADSLFNRSQVVDMGLAEPIHRALLARARQKNDVNRIVYHDYWLCFLNLQWGERLFCAQAERYCNEAVSYLDQYENLEKETRLLMNRCLGNIYVAISSRRYATHDYTAFFAAIDRAVQFWSREDIRALDPDFPWEGFISQSHLSTCAWVDLLRGPLSEDQTLAWRVYYSSEVLYNTDRRAVPALVMWTDSRTLYMLSVARFHVGMLPARATTENLRRLFDDADMADYSQETIYRMLTLSALVLEYMRKIKGIAKEEVDKEEMRVLGRVHQYLKNMPADVDRYQINRAIANFIPYILESVNAEDAIPMLQLFAAYSSLPTRVHCEMMSRILVLLAEYFLPKMPERFIGVLDTETAEEVLARRGEIIARIRLSGLAHDLGKIRYLTAIATCARRITGAEFSIIQAHVNKGTRFDGDMLNDPLISDVIRGHHKWYNGVGGYPSVFDNTASRFRFILDMASVADSIDAATDGFGRSYADQRTLPEVMQEIRLQAGTRYSPVIAEALNAPELAARLAALLETERPAVYYEAYMESQGKTE